MISANVMGLLLALAIHRSSWFNNIARTVLFLPFTVSATAGSIVWSYVFTDVYGTITGLVSPLGMPGQIIYGMVVIGAWRDMGYTMLIYIAALQAVPQDYYEAATVDGAGKLRQFFSVTVPNIVPAFTTNVTLLLAWGLRTFDMPMAVARKMCIRDRPKTDPLSFRGGMDRIFYGLVDPELLMPEEQRIFPEPGNEGRIWETIQKLGKLDMCWGGVGITGPVSYTHLMPACVVE